MSTINDIREYCQNLEKKEILDSLYGKPYNFFYCKHSLIKKDDLEIIGEFIIKNSILKLPPEEIVKKLENQEECWLIKNQEDLERVEKILSQANEKESDSMNDVKNKIEELELSKEKKELLLNYIKEIKKAKNDEEIRKIIDKIFEDRIIESYNLLYPIIRLINPKVNKNFYKQKERKILNKEKL